jgi:hypothetical protein
MMMMGLSGLEYRMAVSVWRSVVFFICGIVGIDEYYSISQQTQPKPTASIINKAFIITRQSNQHHSPNLQYSTNGQHRPISYNNNSNGLIPARLTGVLPTITGTVCKVTG